MANVYRERFICTEEQNILTKVHSVLVQTGKLVCSVEIAYIWQWEQGGRTAEWKPPLLPKGHVYVAKRNTGSETMSTSLATKAPRRVSQPIFLPAEQLENMGNKSSFKEAVILVSKGLRHLEPIHFFPSLQPLPQCLPAFLAKIPAAASWVPTSCSPQIQALANQAFLAQTWGLLKSL